MTNLKLAQLEQLSQQLIYQVKTVNHLMAQVYFEVELTHQISTSFFETYDAFLKEERFYQKH